MTLKRLLHLFVFPLLLLAGEVRAQDRTITGRVTDNTGNPVANASVVVKGGRTGTQTGTDGAFMLRVPANATTLTISYIGFGTQDVTIGTGNIAVTLSPAGAALNEVVVVGYGTQRRRDVTGSISTVSSRDFVKGPITTPEQLIAGKVAGVQISPNNGMPGSGSRIRIRGGTSLNASNDPLIVIDGVPIDNNRIEGAASPLSMINPNDIESMTILKDASAAAIYGNRAANGVILITTKRGVAGRLRVSFSSINSISNKTGTVDVLSADEFRSLVNARGSAGDKAMLGTASTNWQEQIYRSAFSTDNNLSVTGGISNLPYRFNLGYLNQDGILKRSNLQRSSVGLNLSPKFFENHLSVDVNTKYSFQENFFANQGAIGAAVFFDPTKPVMSGKNLYGGYYEWLGPNGGINGLAPRNPIGLLNQREDKSDVNRFIGNVQVDYKMHFLPDLRANVNVGLDRSNGKGTIFVPATAASDSTRGGVNNQYDQQKTNQLFESYLAYAKEILSIRSRFDVVAGYSWQDWKTTANAYPDRRANGSILTPAGQDFETRNTLLSFYGRLNYTFNNRYSGTFTMRRDGSSRFSNNNRWGNFPSAAVAWNIKEESFLKNTTFLTALKFRLGWGITGQQEGIADYGYQSNYFYGDSAARYQFGNTYNVVVRPTPYDEKLQWEETEASNIGLDVSFANNRINFIVDYYNKTTTDLLAAVPTPAGTNFSNILLTNIGSIKNQGLEFTLNVTPVKRQDFTLDLGYNVTYLIQNEITRLQLVQDPNYLGADVGSIGINGTIQKHTVGYRPFTYFLYKQVYDTKDGKPIEGLFEDKNRDGKIDDLDKYWVKNPEPRAFMGFSANASFDKLSAGFSMRGSYGNYVYNNLKAGAGVGQNVFTGQNYLNNAHREILQSGFAGRNFWSDYYLENASFLRMDNAFINYNVGKVWRDRANLRVSLNVQNVFVITNYGGLDPEVGGGIDGSIYPRPRMYALGLNLDF